MSTVSALSLGVVMNYEMGLIQNIISCCVLFTDDFGPVYAGLSSWEPDCNSASFSNYKITLLPHALFVSAMD